MGSMNGRGNSDKDSPFSQTIVEVSLRIALGKSTDFEPRCFLLVLGPTAATHHVLDDRHTFGAFDSFRIGADAADDGDARQLG